MLYASWTKPRIGKYYIGRIGGTSHRVPTVRRKGTGTEGGV